MNLNTIMRAIPHILQAGLHLARKNSPVILTVTAAVGVVGTAVLSTKAGSQISRDIDSEQFGRHPGVPSRTKTQIAKDTWRAWVPPVVSGTLTITSIVLLHTTHARRYAALAGLYTAGAVAFNEYRDSVQAMASKKTMEAIQDDVAEKAVARAETTETHIRDAIGGDTLVYDGFSGRVFKSDIETIRQKVNTFNEVVLHSDSASVNEFYCLLGLEGIQAGEDVGWRCDTGLLTIGYQSILTQEGKPALYLDYETKPTYRFNSNY